MVQVITANVQQGVGTSRCLLKKKVAKTLAPGYRVGWVEPGKFKEKILRLKLLQTISTPPLYQEVIANFMEKGPCEHHLRSLRATLHAGRLQFLRAIEGYFPEGTTVTRPIGGFVLWVDPDKEAATYVLFEKALKKKTC
jgi:DNA-binding transcriptional MocR family regulator